MQAQNNFNKENIYLQCWCQRPKKNIICANCGYVTFGRIRYKCPVHWQTSFLYDIEKCANCRAHCNMLMEFDSETSQ